jgi:mRNA-degrading endonuclease RelE of RelBE toxin-antitoxin system
MQVRLAKEFLKSVKRLPISVRSKTEVQIILLSIDQEHPYLHTKKLQGKPSRHSCRVGREYRILFEIHDTYIYCLYVAHRKDIYKKLR